MGSEALVQAAIDKTIWYDRHSNDDLDEEKEEKTDLGFKANAVLLVAHRLSTVINADKIAVIDKGKIVEFGNHDELLRNKEGVYHKLVERQIQRESNQINQEKESEEEDDNDKGKKKKQKVKKDAVSDDIDSLF